MLAFNRDPLFSTSHHPLLVVETRREWGRERWHIWRAPDFFWFWIEDSPDFFGVFSDGPMRPQMSSLRYGNWFVQTAQSTDLRAMRAEFKHQIHHGAWARAISLADPRADKTGVWRVLWRGRLEFFLQSTVTNRAVRFSPDTHWPKDSPRWREMRRLGQGAEFFAERLWPLLQDRRGRLAGAFEFLELPVEDQEHPLRFGNGTRSEFESLVRAALIACYDWPDGMERRFGVRFTHLDRPPIFDFSAYQREGRICHHRKMQESPLLIAIARSFALHLVPGYSFQSLAPSPFALQGRDTERSVGVSAQGPFTHHERLEARLTVRDWCADNAPGLSPDQT